MTAKQKLLTQLNNKFETIGIIIKYNEPAFYMFKGHNLVGMIIVDEIIIEDNQHNSTIENLIFLTHEKIESEIYFAGVISDSLQINIQQYSENGWQKFQAASFIQEYNNGTLINRLVNGYNAQEKDN